MNQRTEKKIEYGLCECGCGGKTKISKGNDRKNGWIKGQPKRFIKNHHPHGEKSVSWKGGVHIKKNGYIEIRVNHKAEFEHRYIAEKVLGKKLPTGSVVHHWNGYNHLNKMDIVICQDESYHRLLHVRTKAYKACGHADWRICTYCHKYDSIENLNISSNGKKRIKQRIFHIECRRKDSSLRYYKRKCTKFDGREDIKHHGMAAWTVTRTQ